MDSTIVASPDQVSGLLGDETVILQTADGVYYGLDGVGTRIWDLLRVPRTGHEIRDLVLEGFDVDPARCERDVLALLQQLAKHRLIQVLEAQLAGR